MLPHVVLRRSVLPWERRATEAEETGTTRTPWLAIVLEVHPPVGDDGPPGDGPSRTVARSTFFGPPDGTPYHAELAVDGADRVSDATDGVTPTTTLALAIPKSGLPDPTTAQQFCHVRIQDGGRQAFVVSSRRAWPPADSDPEDDAPVPLEGVLVTAHVVSLEKLFTQDLDALDDDDAVLVPSLHHWDYTILPEDEHGFAHLAKRVDVGSLTPSAPSVAPDSTVAGAGIVPLRHELRNGDVVTSWYHGPLSPQAPTFSGIDRPSGADRSDALLVWDPDAGRIDVSYAAAWELGRLLAVHEPQVVEQLLRWKFEHQHRALTSAERGQLHSMVDLLLRPADATPAPGAPADLVDWFESQLTLLDSVPFGYLVPDESMLPPGSLRFFEIDPAWLNCLHDGAASLSRRVGDRADALGAISRSHADEQLALTDTTDWSGFALRSEIVSHYPGTLVTAKIGPKGPDRTDVQPIRRWSPAPDVLMMLYPEKITAVEFEHPIHHVHFSATNLIHHDDGTEVEPGDQSPIAGFSAADVVRHLLVSVDAITYEWDR